MKAAGIIVVIIALSWLGLLLTGTRLLVSKIKVEPGQEYVIEGHGNLGENNQSSLVCKYFNGHKILNTVYWYAPNNIMGRDSCPFIYRGKEQGVLTMTATEAAAWWGAVIASIVLIWDIYKWKHSGARLIVRASPDMETFGGLPDDSTGKKFVLIEVVNIGDRKTTITHLVGYYYSSFFKRLFKKRDKNFFVGAPAYAKPLPYVLDAGEQWTGAVIQNEEMKEMGGKGYLFWGVNHSTGKKGVFTRIKIKNDNA